MIRKSQSWEDFADTDPLYAMLGELGQNKVFSDDGVFDEQKCHSYIERLTRPGVVQKNKDWIEIWATMAIPVERQAPVLQAIIQIGLESDAGDAIPHVLTELIKGHRVKVKSVEEAITTLFEYGGDEQGCIATLLFNIFPKSPTSEWGWSRVGWSWMQWWMLTEKVLTPMDRLSAFECLRSLLTLIENESGMCLPHQQIWEDKRLNMVRTALCQFGSLEEDELPAAIDIVLQ